MIRIGILGAESPVAGELIRILINHPDVVITTAASSQVSSGTRIDAMHPGLIGDTDLTISPTLEPEGHTAVMLCGEPWEAQEWMQRHDEEARRMDLRIIDLTGAFRGDNNPYGMVYGFAENRRKQLVRGAVRASVPSPVAMAVELALFPLAKNMLLPHSGASIAARVELPSPATGHRTTLDPLSAPSGIIASTRLDPIAPIDNRPDAGAFAREIEEELRAIQPTTRPEVNLSLSQAPEGRRTVCAKVTLPLSHSLADLFQRYEDAYSDHNFTYVINRMPTSADVENTNKCILTLGYPGNGDSLQVTAILDAHLKGAAGNAVHILNLLFGLSERTGLALKPSAL